jgi:superfamily I DNA/RNA helicase
MRADFDHILVDEYQDTNRLQAAILLALAPDGAGLTVVGDDAQSIYAFRAATVRNILDFPDQFSPRAAVISLEYNLGKGLGRAHRAYDEKRRSAEGSWQCLLLCGV